MLFLITNPIITTRTSADNEKLETSLKNFIAASEKNNSNDWATSEQITKDFLKKNNLTKSAIKANKLLQELLTNHDLMNNLTENQKEIKQKIEAAKQGAEKRSYIGRFFFGNNQPLIDDYLLQLKSVEAQINTAQLQHEKLKYQLSVLKTQATLGKVEKNLAHITESHGATKEKTSAARDKMKASEKELEEELSKLNDNLNKSELLTSYKQYEKSIQKSNNAIIELRAQQKSTNEAIGIFDAILRQIKFIEETTKNTTLHPLLKKLLPLLIESLKQSNLLLPGGSITPQLLEQLNDPDKIQTIQKTIGSIKNTIESLEKEYQQKRDDIAKKIQENSKINKQNISDAAQQVNDALAKWHADTQKKDQEIHDKLLKYKGYISVFLVVQQYYLQKLATLKIQSNELKRTLLPLIGFIGNVIPKQQPHTQPTITFTPVPLIQAAPKPIELPSPETTVITQSQATQQQPQTEQEKLLLKLKSQLEENEKRIKDNKQLLEMSNTINSDTELDEQPAYYFYPG